MKTLLIILILSTPVKPIKFQSNKKKVAKFKAGAELGKPINK